jgi:hypothetical protein
MEKASFMKRSVTLDPQSSVFRSILWVTAVQAAIRTAATPLKKKLSLNLTLLAF